MRLATWLSYFRTTGFAKEFPYDARSPTLKERVHFESIEDVLDEVERILQEDDAQKIGVGKYLYYNTMFFCNADDLIPMWCWEMLEDYNACKKFNIPLANNLDEASSWMIDCFTVIDLEISKCMEEQREKESDGKR